MKRGICTCIILICIFSANAQEKEKDTIVETEIVNIITKYNPKIADAKKLKNNPTIKLLKKSNKKKIAYTISSAPVASTFIPKTGVVKRPNIAVKERIYNNYLAAGYGNYGSPYAELFIYKEIGYDTKFGGYAKYNASEENIKSSSLKSNFLNFSTTTFFQQNERYFDWKVSLDTQRNNYNWYGLPQDIVFTEPILNTINEEQNYNSLKLVGDFKFHDSYIEFVNLSASYFTDKFKSSERRINFDTKLNYPLGFLSNALNDISVKAGVEFLKGSFKEGYDNTDNINYNQITVKLIPKYKMELLGFSIKASVRTFISLDPENDITNFFMFPDLFLQTTFFKKHINAYGGFKGNLHTNTYQQLIEENPYVSPTLFITQTAESSNFFIGLKGNIARSISYNLKANLKNEEDKPLFLRNNSKSNGTAVSSGEVLEGYEYGNSFTIYYDDVRSTSLFAEIEYLFDNNITFSSQIQFDNYTTTNALENWNLPSLQSSLLAKYETEKWYAIANIFYVSERKDALYNTASSANISSITSLNSFVDVNINGGYHFNDKFSAFLRLKNVLHTNYQRFANFDTQGFQCLGGITYKFDF